MIITPSTIRELSFKKMWLYYWQQRTDERLAIPVGSC